MEKCETVGSAAVTAQPCGAEIGLDVRVIAMAASLTKALSRSKVIKQAYDYKSFKSKSGRSGRLWLRLAGRAKGERRDVALQTVTIQQQIVETCIRQAGKSPLGERQGYGKYHISGPEPGSGRPARLAIYLGPGLRYEKICKSARLMSLAGGEF